MFLHKCIFFLFNLLFLCQACFHKSYLSNKFSSGRFHPKNSSNNESRMVCGPCKEHHDIECEHGGSCCVINGETTCRCLPGYVGDFCEQYQLESSGTKTLTLVSSFFGFLLTFFVFIILLLLVLHIYKANKRRKSAERKRAETLERKMMMIQEDMNRMSQTEKMTKLTRLSKLIEATTRAALITYPGPRIEPLSPYGGKGKLPTIKKKSYRNFRRFSEPTLLTPKPPPPSLLEVRSLLKEEPQRREEVFYSI